MSPALLLPGLILPLVAAPVSFLLGRRALPWLPWLVALMVAGCLCGLAAPLLSEGELFLHLGNWEPPLGLRWRFDGLVWGMIAATTLVCLAVAVYADGYVPNRGRRGRWLGFWPVLFFLWGALNSLFLAGDIFNIYVTLELVSLAAVALVTLDGRPQALAAGMRYLLLALVGSLCYLLGIALLYASFGVLDAALLAERLQPGMTASLAMALLGAGLFLKTALFPVHGWLPAAHGEAPAPASALLSSLVVMGSLYVLLRLWLELFGAVLTPGLRQFVAVLGAAAVLWGSWLAMCQRRLKLVVAYSTVAQLGYPLLMVPLLETSGAAAAWSGGFYLLLSHALAKASMFLVAGVLLHAQGHDRIFQSRGFAGRYPMSVFAFGLAALTLLALPPSGGFIGKWLLLEASFGSGQWWWGLVLLLGGLLAAGYVFRVLVPIFGDAGHRHLEAVPLRMELAALSLAVGSVVLGLVAGAPVRALQAVVLP